jgi:3,4-dihydroxy-2-butanone 4-phosphate synthase
VGSCTTQGPGVQPDEDEERAREEFEFASIADAIDELRAGRMVVVVDDEDRENEGDLMMAADTITPEAINFMATRGRGLICLAMTGQKLDELGLDEMPRGDASGGTAFTVSIDLKGRGVATGISAHDRAQTIRAIETGSRPEDFSRPGHVRLRHSKIHAADCAACETRDGLLDHIDREIELVGVLGDEQRARLLDIANKCPVHRTLTSEIHIQTRLTRREEDPVSRSEGG